MTRTIQLTLLLLIAVLTLASFVFALAHALWLALAAMWIVNWARVAIHPLTLIWINRGLEPSSRATVLSMLGQGDALGQVAGGPALGGLGALSGVRAALLGAGVLTAPALAIYGRVATKWDQEE